MADSPNPSTHVPTHIPAAASTSAPWLTALRTDAPSALLAILLLVLPLYRTSALEDSFNTPKLALALILAVFAAIGVLARPQSFRMRLRWYPAPWLIVGLATWQAASVLWAESKPLGVDGTVYFATFAVLLWLFYRGPNSVASLRGLFHAGATGAVLTAIWVLTDDFTHGLGGLVARLPDWRGHLAAGLGNSGHIAGMVGMFLPWVLLCMLCSASRFRWLLLVPIALMFAALAVTWSVGSSGATIASLLLWGIIAARALPSGLLRWRRLASIIAIGLAVCAFYFTPNPLNPHKPTLWKEAFSSQRWEDGWPTRVVIWETTWQLIRSSPMVGIGTGNFTYGYTQQVVPSITENPKLNMYAGAFTNDAHNDYLQLWAEGGVVALGLWLGVLLVFGKTLTRLLRHPSVDADTSVILIAAGAGLTVFALDGLMSFPMRLPAHFAAAMFFVAVPGVVQRLAGTSRPAPARRSSLRIGGVGVLLTLAACVWHHGHRVVAEYQLKSGRTAADAVQVQTPQGQFPLWTMCDRLYQQSLTAIATGQPEADWRAILNQLQALAQGPGLDAARLKFEQAIAADRWYANASSRLGQLLIFQGKYHQSLEASSRTLKTLEAFEVHELMGAAAFFAGDKAKARDQWQICLTRRPEMADFYNALIEQTRQ